MEYLKQILKVFKKILGIYPQMEDDPRLKNWNGIEIIDEEEFTEDFNKEMNNRITPNE